VSSEWRGRGYGTALVKLIEERFTAAGCPKVNLLVRAANTPVLEFYRRIGYTSDDAIPLGKRLILDLPAVLPT
ncbi:MAG: GNAT family N-acetyltransferase, partial [Burkholderiaceae bacterium]|nr:GNAT family N-acetyltransferase [Burkholderiaceae bacterium]